MKTLNEYIEAQRENSEFDRVWRKGEGKYQAMCELVRARTGSYGSGNLLEASSVPQKTISLIETAGTNTAVRTLSKLARGMGKPLTVRFVDADEHEARA